MSDNVVVVMILGAVAVALLMLFPPGRELLLFASGQAWKGTMWMLGVIAAGVQIVAVAVWRAHLTVIRNLGPRVAVLPSVGTKTTRR